jgi:ribosomal protein S18 acetylase RimI-like enzyme
MSQPSALSIRPATPADIPPLVEMVNAAFSIETFLEGQRTDAERLASTLQKGEILLAEDADGHVLGSVYIEFRGKRGYMGMLAVAPTQQGNGLARRLLTVAEDLFRQKGCEAIDISVLSLRPELIPIYERFGFKECGTEEFRFARTFRDQDAACHCILMAKEL